LSVLGIVSRPMSAAEKDTPPAEALREILDTELGEPAPVADYHHPLEPEDRADLDAQLDDIEPAHAAAAARLHTLYAD
jgi:hypothetical protein